MKKIILLESDRIVSKCISDELKKHGFYTTITCSADEAIAAADKNKPDAIISDLVVSNHSGSEFLYEFRTYSDWKDVPIIIYSSLLPSAEIMNSNDFKMLNIYDFLYKPKTSLDSLSKRVISATS
jgi:DNA-binding response OmpR family regulator